MSESGERRALSAPANPPANKEEIQRGTTNHETTH